MDWEDLFREVILDRGYDYYLEDAVELQNVTNDHIEAIVSGNEEYEVEIDFDHDRIVGMYCSCPYAEKGYNCKHMAAVLYKWQENKQDQLVISNDCSSTDSNNTLTNLIKGADRKQINEFLYDVLNNDTNLLTKFRQYINNYEISINEYKNEIDQVVRSYLGRNYFISYGEANDFIDAMENYIYHDVNGMIDDGDYLKAFELTCYLFVKVGNVDIDDSDGGTGMFADLCFKTWNQILDECDKKIEEKIYNWFIGHLNGSVIDYMEDYIENILMSRFKSEKFLKEKLRYTENKVNFLKKQSGNWYTDFIIEKWVLHHLEIMEELKYSVDDIYSYCQKYWQYSRIREYYISICINQKNYNEAIQLINESLQLDAGKRGLIIEYRTKLKEIYKQINNDDAYKEQLWQLVTTDNPGNLDDFNELKSLYSNKEWINIREQIFAMLPENVRIDRLFEQEKLYDRLLMYVLKTPGLSCLFEYEKVLKSQYPQELLQKYTDELNQKARYTANRKTYQEWVMILKRMTKITGGNIAVKKIVTEWKKIYKNRRAMMEELNRL